MPRRRSVAREQFEELLALPIAEPELIRHWTLSAADLAAIERRRRDPNQLGFALQLCVFRYPGRLLRPREVIPEAALVFVAGQLRVAPGALADYAARRQTRREQLRALRTAFGFRMFAPGHRRELLARLLPVALANTDAIAIAATLMDELRRQKIIAPGASVIERLVAAAATLAERQVADQLTGGLLPSQAKALDALLTTKEGASMSGLAWARQPPGVPGHRALAILVNAQQRQPLAALFGAADVSSSDGQHFPTAGPGEAVGAVNAHYERAASALFYTHLSARQAPYHTVAIPPSGEAAYVIDGLLYHEADLSIATHHTDGGGVSDHVFALAYLLGFHFAPRIPNLAERRLYTFGASSASPVFEPFIGGRIDEKLITAYWNDVLRLATSIRTGAASASLPSSASVLIHARTAWHWPYAKSVGSSERYLCSTG